VTVSGTRSAIRASSVIAAPELLERSDSRPVVVEFGELPSALMLLVEELGGRSFGAPSAWRKAAVSQLRARDVAALAPFVTAEPARLPTSVIPSRTRSTPPGLDEDLERIAATPPDLLVAQLEADPRWAAVVRSPRRWLDAYVCAVRRACAGMREPWKRATGVLDREAERVGVATARGTQRELIASLVPPTMWRLEGPAPHHGGRRDRLGLVPLLAGPRSTHVRLSNGDLTHIAYPIFGVRRLFDDGAIPPPALDALLGAPRALILRQLERPMTAGKLADALVAVPSAASHHLGVLERAGLVARERQGQHVLVRRTVRGSEILALYE
jgi:DNA-binding transcriptional ArsR family regulator